MEEIERTFLTDRTKRIVFVLFTFVLFYLVSFLIDPYGQYWKNYWDKDLFDLIAEWLVTFLFCFLIAETSLLIHNKLNKRLPWIKSPAKRVIIETALNICAVLLLIVLNVLFLYSIYNKSHPSETEFSNNNIRDLLQWMVISFVMSFIIVAVNTGSYLLNNWKNTDLQVMEHKLRVSELKQASVEAELNALQLQIDPHFIFNNLSVLSELILENQNLAYQFSENFSKVYRFLLVNSKKNIISLADEMKFLNAYIFLIQHRIGEGVRFDIKVDETSNRLFIPPFTLQLLVENALKHNKTNRNDPLFINIYNDGADQIVVENKLVPLIDKAPHSTGTGLSNIKERFTLLSKQIPDIIIEDGFFKVIIHLMSYDT